MLVASILAICQSNLLLKNHHAYSDMFPFTLTFFFHLVSMGTQDTLQRGVVCDFSECMDYKVGYYFSMSDSSVVQPQKSRGPPSELGAKVKSCTHLKRRIFHGQDGLKHILSTML